MIPLSAFVRPIRSAALIVPLCWAVGCGSAPVRLDRATVPRDPAAAAARATDGALWELQGDVPRAVVAYEAALRLDPLGAGIHARLSALYDVLGRPSDARWMAFRAVELAPTEAEFRARLGAVYLASGDTAEALAEYEQWARLRPDDPVPLFTLADLHRVARRPAAARRGYERLMDRFGPHLDALYRLYQIQLDQSDEVGALSSLEAMHELTPSNDQLVRSLAEAYGVTGRPERGIPLLEALLSRQPDDLETLGSLSGLYAAGGQADRAAALVEQTFRLPQLSLEQKLTVARQILPVAATDPAANDVAERLFDHLRVQYPSDARSHLSLGILANGRGAYPAAESLLRRAVALAPRNPDGWCQLAVSLHGQQRWTAMAAAMDTAARLIPEEPRVPYFRGVALLQLGQTAPGLDALETVLWLGSADRDLLLDAALRLATGYVRTGQDQEADRAFERALDLAPSHATALNGYAVALADRGERLEEALALARRAVALDPERAPFWDTLGRILLGLNRLAEAEWTLQQAVARGGNAAVEEHLGDVYAAQGRPAEARRWWQRAWERAPDERPALRRKLGR